MSNDVDEGAGVSRRDGGGGGVGGVRRGGVAGGLVVEDEEDGVVSLFSPLGSAAPPFTSALLRCTSTPIVASPYDLSSVLELEREAQLTFSGGLGKRSRTPPFQPPHPLRRSPPRRSPRTKSLQDVSILTFSCSSETDDEAETTTTAGEGDSGIHTMSPSTAAAAASSPSCSSSLEDISDLERDCSDDRSSSLSDLGAIPKTRGWVKRKALLRRQRDLCQSSGSSSTSSHADSALSNRRFSYRCGHFMGRETVDVMRHLLDMNMSLVTRRIFGYLGAKDLCSSAQVSSTWNATILLDLDATRRKKEFLLKQKLNLENLLADAHRHHGSPRKAMTNRSNLLSPTHSKRDREISASIIVSPSKIRHQLFTEEASKLSPGEQLQCCPRCSSPSRVTPAEFKATCTRVSCSWTFCTRCFCDHHDAACRVTGKALGKSAKGTVASRKSKSRLKRL